MMAHRQGTTTVTTVYTNSPQTVAYPAVVSQPVLVQNTVITFKPEDVKSCKINGVLQLTLGGLCIIFGIVSTAIHCYFGYQGTPIWCGFWFLLAGFCGVSVGRYQDFMAQKSLVRFTWLSSLSTAFSVTLLIYMSMALKWELYYIDPYDQVPNRRTRRAIDGVILTFACLEFFLSIHASCLARKTMCRADKETVTTQRPAASYGVTAAYPPPGGNPGYSYPAAAYPPPQGQYGFAQGQPQPYTAPPPAYTYAQPQPNGSAESKAMP